jgi:hypothetical protein
MKSLAALIVAATLACTPVLGGEYDSIHTVLVGSSHRSTIQLDDSTWVPWSNDYSRIEPGFDVDAYFVQRLTELLQPHFQVRATSTANAITLSKGQSAPAMPADTAYVIVEPNSPYPRIPVGIRLEHHAGPLRDLTTLYVFYLVKAYSGDDSSRIDYGTGTDPDTHGWTGLILACDNKLWAVDAKGYSPDELPMLKTVVTRAIDRTLPIALARAHLITDAEATAALPPGWDNDPVCHIHD